MPPDPVNQVLKSLGSGSIAIGEGCARRQRHGEIGMRLEDVGHGQNIIRVMAVSAACLPWSLSIVTLGKGRLGLLDG
jgi:hypothetical protein